MQKFQMEYEDQLTTWNKDKSDREMRIQELQAYTEKVKFDS